VIEELAGGKRSGAALVFFEDENTAIEAKKLNKTNLGTRYVELFSYQDQFMQQLCGLKPEKEQENEEK